MRADAIHQQADRVRPDDSADVIERRHAGGLCGRVSPKPSSDVGSQLIAR